MPLDSTSNNTGLFYLKGVSDESIIRVQGNMYKRMFGPRWHKRFCYMIGNELYVAKIAPCEQDDNNAHEYYCIACYDLTNTSNLNVAMKALKKVHADGSTSMFSLKVKNEGTKEVRLRMFDVEDKCREWMQLMINFHRVALPPQPCLPLFTPVIGQTASRISQQLHANHEGNETLSEKWKTMRETMAVVYHDDEDDTVTDNKYRVPPPSVDSQYVSESITDDSVEVAVPVLHTKADSDEGEPSVTVTTEKEIVFMESDKDVSPEVPTPSSKTFPITSELSYDGTQVSSGSDACSSPTKFFSSMSTSSVCLTDGLLHTAVSFCTTPIDVLSTQQTLSPSHASYIVNEDGHASVSEGPFVSADDTRVGLVKDEGEPCARTEDYVSSMETVCSHFTTSMQTVDDSVCAGSDLHPQHSLIATFDIQPQDSDQHEDVVMVPVLETEMRQADSESGDHDDDLDKLIRGQQCDEYGNTPLICNNKGDNEAINNHHLLNFSYEHVEQLMDEESAEASDFHVADLCYYTKGDKHNVKDVILDVEKLIHAHDSY